MMKRALIFFLLIASTVFSLSQQQLKLTDVRNSVEEMLSYHVEYKELTPLLVKRSFKSYIEQFDPQKIFLLQSEVKSFLDLSSTQIETTIDQYFADAYPEYEKLNQLIGKSIQRARVLRKEIFQELLSSGDKLQAREIEQASNWATTTDQLKGRLRAILARLIVSERRSNDPAFWTQERRTKIAALFEKRFARFENSYLENEHFFAMHILKAMARSLDAHTAYFSPEEASEMRAALEKQFEGVGIVLKEGIDGVEIADLVKGGPAARSGQIEVGDFLVEIDGKSVSSNPYDNVLEQLKGNGSKDVSLGLKRYATNGQEKVVHVNLKREKILMEEERLVYEAEPFGDGIIGKLTLPSFYESYGSNSCEMDIREALKELKRKGNLVGIVLDMRENLGGFLNQAVKVAGLFITSGVVVISKYAQGEVQYMRNVDPRVYYNGPLVILTSKLSASAAEIVAQALQDYGIGLVVGDKTTYGKGTIQYQTVTDDDASSFFKVTVGRYYTVSGHSTQIEGVQADIVVPTEFAPYNIGERYLEYPLHNDRVAPAYTDPLTDVDGQAKMWFQKNYLPNIQKKESTWRKMLPELKANSSYRLEHDPNFKVFLSQLSPNAEPLEKGQNWGEEDLQMNEAVSILKDMLTLK
jgi:carboxyl-terminal processing protease